MKFGNIKIWQISSILRLIYKKPGITRIELSKKLRLDKSMVSKHINFLQVNGWIKDNKLGEKKIPLNIAKDRILAAGVEIQPEYQKVVICDLSGGIIEEVEWNDSLISIQEFVDGKLTEFLSSSKHHLLAIGIGLPGVINKSSNEILSSNPLKIDSPEKLPKFIKGIKYPIYYENDIRCCGWGITSFRKEKQNFILLSSIFHDFNQQSDVYSRISLGSALFLNQVSFEGSHFCAGEFRGIYTKKASNNFSPLFDHSTLVKMKHDETILNSFIKELSVHFSFIANYLDVDKIYILGNLETFRMQIEREFRKSLLVNSPFPHLQKSKIIYASFREHPVSIGATGMAFENLFSEPSLENPTAFYLDLLNKILI